MNRFDHQWQKLTALARQAPREESVPAPFGFATRLAATGLAAPAENPWASFERYALRGLLAAVTVSAAAVAFNLTSGANGAEDFLFADDTVSQILDFS